jgi:hypothetical protein
MQRDRTVRSLYTISFVVCAAFVALLAGGCARPPDAATRIRSTIEAMREAAEARDAGGVLDHVASDFTGRGGEIDREGLARILKIEFLRNQDIGVRLGSVDIEIDGDRATARFDMTLIDGSRRWLPSGRETYAVVSGWRREGSAWTCYNATWDAKE